MSVETEACTDLTFLVGSIETTSRRRTLRPWQWILEAPHKVEHAPRNDGVVVESNIKRDNGRCNAYSCKIWRNLTPHADCTFSQSLSNRQLQKENWESFYCQHDKVGDEEGA